MRTVVNCHGHNLICNMLLLQLVGMFPVLFYILSSHVFLAKNVLRHAVRMTFLDGKNYGTNSTVFPTSFLSFFLKTKLSVSPTNFTDVLLIGSNVT